MINILLPIKMSPTDDKARRPTPPVSAQLPAPVCRLIRFPVCVAFPQSLTTGGVGIPHLTASRGQALVADPSLTFAPAGPPSWAVFP